MMKDGSISKVVLPNLYDEDGRSLTHYITNISSFDVTYGRWNDVCGQYVYNGDARNRDYYLRCAAKMGEDDVSAKQ